MVLGLDRRVAFISFGSFLIVAARMSLVTFLGIFLTRERGLSVTDVGFAFLVENLVGALVQPFGGALSDRVGRRPVILGGLLLMLAVLPSFLLIRDVPTLLVWSVLLGLGGGFQRPAATALLLDLVPVSQRQTALALNYTALSVGYTLGVAPAGFLAARGYLFLAAASGIGILAVLELYVFAFRAPVPREARAGGQPGMISSATRAVRDPAFVLLAVLAFAFPLGIGVQTTALPLYGVDAGLSTVVIGLALAVNGVVLAVATIPATRRMAGGGPYRLLPIAAAGVALSYFALAPAGTPTTFVASVILFSLGEVVFSTALPTAVAALAPPGERGAYQGAWGMVFSLALGCSLVLAGLSREAVGWRATWLLFGVLTLAAGVGLALARPRFRRLADARAERA